LPSTKRKPDPAGKLFGVNRESGSPAPDFFCPASGSGSSRSGPSVWIRTIVRFFRRFLLQEIFWTKKINYFVDRCSNDCYIRIIQTTGKEKQMLTFKHFNDTGFIAHMSEKKSNKNKEAVEFFLKYPDKWHSYANDYITTDIICRLVNLKILNHNQYNQVKVNSFNANLYLKQT
jgi:hypothetical protein